MLNGDPNLAVGEFRVTRNITDPLNETFLRRKRYTLGNIVNYYHDELPASRKYRSESIFGHATWLNPVRMNLRALRIVRADWSINDSRERDPVGLSWKRKLVARILLPSGAPSTRKNCFRCTLPDWSSITASGGSRGQWQISPKRKANGATQNS